MKEIELLLLTFVVFEVVIRDQRATNPSYFSVIYEDNTAGNDDYDNDYNVMVHITT